MTLTQPQSLPVPSPLPGLCQTLTFPPSTLPPTHTTECVHKCLLFSPADRHLNQNLLLPPPSLLLNPSSPLFLSSLPGYWALPVTRVWPCLPSAGVTYCPTKLWAAYLPVHTCSPFAHPDHLSWLWPLSNFSHLFLYLWNTVGSNPDSSAS